jgi:poly(3-hydroxybutyrate) depolymerase
MAVPSGARPWRVNLALVALVGGLCAAGATAGSPAANATDWQPAPHQAAGRDTSVVIELGGFRRHYTVFVPNKPASRPGLLVALHGFAHTGFHMEDYTYLDDTAARLGYYVAYPYGLAGSLNAGLCCQPASRSHVDDVGFIDRVVKDVRNRYRISARRVLVGGNSLGANFAFHYACHTTQQIAGIFASVGSARFATCGRTQPLHVLAINGLRDVTEPWNGRSSVTGLKQAMDTFELANGCGPGWTTTTDWRGNQKQVADRCRSGASIEQWLVTKMDHRWVIDPTEVALYSFNTTVAIWTWARRILTLDEDIPPLSRLPIVPVPREQPATHFGGPIRTSERATVVPDTDESESVRRSYRLFVPDTPAADPGLLVMLHGERSGATQMEAMAGLDATIGAAGNYVLYPEGPGHNWNAGSCCGPRAKAKVTDVGYLDGIIAEVLTTHPDIGTHVAIGGFSAGAIMALQYVCHGHTHVTELVVVAGVALQTCLSIPPVEVLAINGLRDETVQWDHKNMQPMFMRTVGKTVNLQSVFAGMLGGWYWRYETPPSPNDQRMIAGGTYPGYGMVQLVIEQLDHRWTSTAADHRTYGVNATAEVADFLLPRWS